MTKILFYHSNFTASIFLFPNNFSYFVSQTIFAVFIFFRFWFHILSLSFFDLKNEMPQKKCYFFLLKKSMAFGNFYLGNLTTSENIILLVCMKYVYIYITWWIKLNITCRKDIDFLTLFDVMWLWVVEQVYYVYCCNVCSSALLFFSFFEIFML